MDERTRLRLIDFLDRNGAWPHFVSTQQLMLRLDEIDMTADEFEAAIDELEEEGVVVTAGRGGAMNGVIPGVTFKNGVHHLRIANSVKR